MSRLLAAMCLVMMGCSNTIRTTDNKFPSDGDADTDADTDTDTDTDEDTDVHWCDMEYDTPVPGSDPSGHCVTEKLRCGDTRFHTTLGGSEIYDYGYWELNQTTNDLEIESVDGPERIYVIEGILPDHYAHVTVESCEDVYAAFYVSGDLTGYCETGFSNTPKQHFYKDPVYRRRLQDAVIENNTTTGMYDAQVIVDSPAGSDINFKITVECGP